MWISQYNLAFVIGSDRCSATERLKGPEAPAQRAQTIAESLAHTKCMLEIYQQQIKQGRYFLHMNSTQAWANTHDALQFAVKSSAFKVKVGNVMCMTNVVRVSETLAEGCPDAGGPIHPPRFVSQILRGLRTQMCLDERTGPLEIGCLYGFENKRDQVSISAV